jgi:hypothetical protein
MVVAIDAGRRRLTLSPRMQSGSRLRLGFCYLTFGRSRLQRGRREAHLAGPAVRDDEDLRPVPAKTMLSPISVRPTLRPSQLKNALYFLASSLQL